MGASGFDFRSSLGLLLLRLMVGWVFLSEGLLKFLYPATLGAGRFGRIGIPFPQFSGPFVGVVEIVCGALLIVGLAATFATFVLLIDIAVAIVMTKVPLMKHGFWIAMHNARTDLCMFLGLLAIALLGAGRLSFEGGRRGK
jgi:uncharacterized membrane protein YphA (DoxX/SURF4 family)